MNFYYFIQNILIYFHEIEIDYFVNFNHFNNQNEIDERINE